MAVNSVNRYISKLSLHFQSNRDNSFFFFFPHLTSASWFKPPKYEFRVYRINSAPPIPIHSVPLLTENQYYLLLIYLSRDVMHVQVSNSSPFSHMLLFFFSLYTNDKMLYILLNSVLCRPFHVNILRASQFFCDYIVFLYVGVMLLLRQITSFG